MILYLTDSLRNNGNEDSASLNRLKHCIRNIANAAIEGCHILRGDYDILCDCKAMFSGDEEFAAFFSEMVNNYFSATVPPDISYYIEIVKDNPQERIAENGCIIAQKCIDDFYLSRSLLCCQLVCEDENDCKFYRFVAEWYIKKNHLKYKLNLDEDGGGGERTIEKVKKHISDGVICLCIVDTDKKYPEMEINQTSKSCIKFDNHRCGYRCIAINAQEIENILPLNYIDDLMSTESKYNWELCQQQKRHFDYLSRGEKADSLLPYFDYKKGIKKTKEYKESVFYQKYAKMCWEQNPEINKDNTFEEYVATIPDDGKIYFKLSESISSDTLGYIKSRKANDTLEEPKLLGFQEEEWQRIGKEIVNWGCCRIPEGIS